MHEFPGAYTSSSPRLSAAGRLRVVLASGVASLAACVAPSAGSAPPEPARTLAQEAPDAPSEMPAEGAELENPELAQPTPGDERTEPRTAPASESTSSLVHGSLTMRYRGRFTGDDQDQELRTLLALDLADPKAPWITGHLLARADLDLDGLDEGPVFQDLSDTYDGSLVTKLYLAYADLALGPTPEEGPGTLRIGRQSDPRLPEVLRLDGVSYLTRPMGERAIEVGVYGGVPVHLYESSSEGDRAYGTFVEGKPWSGARARADWMHLEDEQLLGSERDDLLAFGLWQTLARRWRLEGGFSRLENEPRDLRLRAFYQDPESETVARVGYYELQSTQSVRAQELDPFYDSLLELFPYRQLTLNASRALGEHVKADAGYDVRRVSDSGDVGDFNRDWQRLYGTLTLREPGVEGLSLSLTADRWNDEQRDIGSLGADLSLERDEWSASVGSYYSLYKYELLELDERENVRTWYLRTTRKLSARLRLELGYEYEDDDLDTYHTLRGGAQWRF